MKKITRLINLEKKYIQQVADLSAEFQQKHAEMVASSEARITDLSNKIAHKEDIIAQVVSERLPQYSESDSVHIFQIDTVRARKMILQALE